MSKKIVNLIQNDVITISPHSCNSNEIEELISDLSSDEFSSLFFFIVVNNKCQ